MPIVKCKICNKSFYAKPSQRARGVGKYCSRRCRDIGWKKGKFVFCDTCGKQVWRAPRYLIKSKSKKFFCSKSCQTVWRNKYYSGENHPLWNGGTFIYRQILVGSGKKAICRKCRIEDERLLVAHHKDRNRKNNAIENLEWLCRNCHYLVHYHENN